MNRGVKKYTTRTRMLCIGYHSTNARQNSKMGAAKSNCLWIEMCLLVALSLKTQISNLCLCKISCFRIRYSNKLQDLKNIPFRYLLFACVASCQEPFCLVFDHNITIVRLGFGFIVHVLLFIIFLLSLIRSLW